MFYGCFLNCSDMIVMEELKTLVGLWNPPASFSLDITDRQTRSQVVSQKPVVFHLNTDGNAVDTWLDSCSQWLKVPGILILLAHAPVPHVTQLDIWHKFAWRTCIYWIILDQKLPDSIVESALFPQCFIQYWSTEDNIQICHWSQINNITEYQVRFKPLDRKWMML